MFRFNASFLHRIINQIFDEIDMFSGFGQLKLISKFFEVTMQIR